MLTLPALQLAVQGTVTSPFVRRCNWMGHGLGREEEGKIPFVKQ